MKLLTFIFSMFVICSSVVGQGLQVQWAANCEFSGFTALTGDTYRGNIINFTDQLGGG